MTWMNKNKKLNTKTNATDKSIGSDAAVPPNVSFHLIGKKFALDPDWSDWDFHVVAPPVLCTKIHSEHC